MSKNLVQEAINAATNRRSFIKKIGVASAAVGAYATMGAVPADAQTSTEVNVLNFALNLEYLEAEFYTYALTGQSITAYGIGINGKANSGNPTSGGTATGGKKVTFSNNLIFSADIAAQIASDERAHVKLLRSLLGSAAIAQPNINLNALGFGFGNQNEFLKLARIFEDIGVTAYAGAAPLLSTPAVISYAAASLPWSRSTSPASAPRSPASTSPPHPRSTASIFCHRPAVRRQPISPSSPATAWSKPARPARCSTSRSACWPTRPEAASSPMA